MSMSVILTFLCDNCTSASRDCEEDILLKDDDCDDQDEINSLGLAISNEE